MLGLLAEAAIEPVVARDAAQPGTIAAVPTETLACNHSRRVKYELSASLAIEAFVALLLAR
jgi:hypothetical protein